MLSSCAVATNWCVASSRIHRTWRLKESDWRSEFTAWSNRSALISPRLIPKRLVNFRGLGLEV
jgi:hypothetical protein